MRNRLPNVAWILLALVLAIASAPVAALGLGQVEVLSRPGEPLVAQIPVISADPRELDQLQARLASPETFRRIGLEPPGGAVTDLQFSVALDARGNPVVRVTSARPIDQPLLTFLLEVDWGQGRLVREYSVLVDAPQSAVAVDQPPVQAPLPAPTTTVVRPPEVVQPVEPEPQVQAETLPDAPPPVPEAQPQPAPAQVVAAPPPMPEPAPPAPSGEYGPVQRGQTLSQIASGVGQDGYSLNQRMLALLRENPDAFIDGNINLLREGAVLRMPGRDVLAELSPSEANAVVRAQVRSWRERQAPPAVAADAVADATDAPAADAPRRDASDATGDSPAPVADARLQIVPPAGEGGQAPGSRSGMSAGGEGDMLRNDLRQAKEDLATRDAEVEELRTRLAELEELQQKQAQLLDLKDSELAAVQQRLAQSRAADAAGASPPTAAAVPGAQPATQATQAVEAQPVAEPRTDDAAPSWPWLLGGLLLVALAGAAWWWQRRRREEPVPVVPPARRNYDTAAMAAGLSATGRPEAGAPAPGPARAGSAPAAPASATTRPVATAVPPAPTPPASAAPTPAAPATPARQAPPAASTPAASAPAGTRPPTPATPSPTPPAGTPVPPPGDQAPAPPAEPAPTWHAGPLPEAPEGGAAAAPATGRDGLELARAYLDLGDNQAARTLLREVLLGRDPNAREEAARMLRELG